MSDQEQAMKLIAEIVDKYSGPLKEMQRALKQTADATKGMHASGAAQAREHAKAYRELKESIGKAKENVSSVLSPALVGLGITALSVESAVGGIIASIRDLGTSSRQLALISRQTGFAINDLRVLENMWQRQGQSVGDTDMALRKFTQTQAEFANKNEAVWESFARIGPKALEFEKSIQGMSPTEKLSRSIAFRRSITEQYKREQFDELMGLNESMDIGATPERYKAAKEDIAKNPKDIDKGLKTAETMQELAIAIGNVQEALAEKFSGPVLAAVTKIKDFLDDKEAIDHFANKMGEAGEGIASVFRGFENLQTILNWDPTTGIEKLKTDLAKTSRPGTVDERFGPFSGQTDANLSSLKDAMKESTKAGMLDAFREWFMGLGSTDAKADLYRPMAYHPDGGLGSRGGGGYFGSKEYPAISDPGAGGGNPGRGEFNSGKTTTAKAAFMDQLRKEGVPEGNIEHAASLLTGQAIAESGLNPNASHDGGSGYGIYGAGKGRRTSMLNWLASNGFAANSLEGQAKYMAHEAMTGKGYGPSRNALMTAGPNNMESGTRTLTHNFESPSIENWGARLKNSMTALKAGHGQAQGAPPAGSNAASGVGNLDGVDPEFGARLRSMWDASPDSAKAGAGVISGLRSRELQAQLYERYRSGRGGIAAPPGHSQHETGHAADWHDPSGWFHQHAKEYGVTFPLGRRDWPHSQMDPAYRGKSFLNGSPMKDSSAGIMKGNASLDISLNGFPRGTKTKAAIQGMFKTVTLNRGMPTPEMGDVA
jgi:hypothetical protein